MTKAVMTMTMAVLILFQFQLLALPYACINETVDAQGQTSLFLKMGTKVETS
jgi:hypothetical protein